MAEHPDEGLLSQDDIDAALAAAGLSSETNAASAPDPQPTAGPQDPPAEDTPVDAAGQPVDEAAQPAAIEEAPAAQTTAIEETPAADPSARLSPFQIPELATDGGDSEQIQGIDLLRDVELDVKIELGRSRMLIDDVLRLGEGSVVELDKLAGDPVDVFVNDRLVARGEVLVLNDNFCVRINDILKEEMDQVQ
ncbi:MAG TPA: flagellar motor switch protein FliN [Phycisphaerae bacterium]|jgi:flagellar motor switch protein FliN/FliY|nr:flagellar motor switch protein FliN [Phycisphaerae bacterium]HOJ55006.1 flagellar motor switch protein FliN [Phycisphaerae bacterium]HOL26973.1 flagellar motor switch protein FliN [Phycisphaerae bacterium]HPP21402.1 flagellar motor switch protein FliN [Phycisphaerae bacterium]HPU33283.1 flagellar motor switch protein FliN [Phycisphaerae bacterium]